MTKRKLSEELAGSDTVKAVYEQCELMVNSVLSEDMLRRPHGEVEQSINTQGHELMRRLMQANLVERAKTELRLDEVTGGDDLVRNHVKDGCERRLMTLFGEVVVRRLGYGKYGGQYLYPLDAELNLSDEIYSDGIRRRTVEETVHDSYDEVVASVQRTTSGKVPKRQSVKLVVGTAQDFEGFYATSTANVTANADDLLILSTDGKGIVMRQDALREVTQKAAVKEQHKLKARLSKGEKSNRKRIATVAAVYNIERNVRSAEKIMKLEEEEVEQTPPRAKEKRVWASVEREQRTVIEEMFQEALKRDPERKRQRGILIDGQPQQLKIIKDCMKQYGMADSILILDFIHVLEYLWKAAFCFCTEGSKEAESWVLKRALLILKGKSSGVAAGMRRSATLRKLSTQARKPVDTCAAYLHKYKEMLRYDKFLEQGFPIATGIIEGACRHLIKDRMDRTGARWGLIGAESVLKLRSLKSSRDFDAYWEYYKSQSLIRIHASHYAGGIVPLAHAA